MSADRTFMLLMNWKCSETLRSKRKIAKRIQLMEKKKAQWEKDKLLKKLILNEKISSYGPSIIQTNCTILDGIKKLKAFTWKLTELMKYKK